MSLETDYDAWVRGLMRNVRGTPAQADAADETLRAMQAELDALSAGPARAQKAGEAADAVRNAADKTADAVRRMSSELARNLRSDGLLEREAAARPRRMRRPGPPRAAGLTAWPMQSAPRCLGRMILWRRWSRRSAAPL